MKTKLIIILLLSYGAAMAQKIQKAQLFYASDQYDLTDEHKQKLKTLCDSLKNYNIVQISIKGYTDSDADSIYNIGLSNKRTNQVKNELLNLGINKRIIFENYFGEKYASFDSISEDKKSRNRRVDIIATLLLTEKKVIVKDSCIDGDTSLVMENGTIFKMKSSLKVIS
jgi:outer membrane protein OmpA-like peptidoglycan-associated protein